MTHAPDRIVLAPSVQRCRPGNPCRWKHDCARNIAAIPAVGGSVADYSTSLTHSLVCMQQISLDAARRSMGIKPARPVHEAPSGIGRVAP